MVQDPLRGRLIPVAVKTLLLDPTQNTPVLVLQEELPGEGGEASAEAASRQPRILPIWIGLFEASAIQMHIEGTEIARPLTHDLMASLLEAVDCQLIAVVVHSLEEGTFYATLRLQAGEHLLDVDSRPSDAIALALRAGAEIFVGEHVFDRLEDQNRPQHEREQALKEWFENLDPDDLGKYTM